MVYARLDDHFFGHKKTLALLSEPYGLAAIGVHALVLSWVGMWETDGWFPRTLPKQLAHRIVTREVNLLLEKGQWEASPQRPDEYFLHDYLDWNKSKKQQEAIRDAQVKGGRKGTKARYGKPGYGAASLSLPIGPLDGDSEVSQPMSPPIGQPQVDPLVDLAHNQNLNHVTPDGVPRQDAGSLTALFVTDMEAKDRYVSNSMRVQFGREAKAILAAGITYAVAVAATKKLVEKSLRPALLGSLVNDDDVRAGYGATDDVRMQFLRAQYRRIGDRARSLAESDDEWREAMEGV